MPLADVSLLENELNRQNANFAKFGPPKVAVKKE